MRTWILLSAVTLAIGADDAPPTPPDRAPVRYPVQPAAAWERAPGNLLAGFYNMYQPCVVEAPGDEYPYRMFFFGWASDWGNSRFRGCDAVFHARSRNLENWEVYSDKGTWDSGASPERWEPVLQASDKRYDEWHNGDPSVVYKDGRYYMAYSATSEPDYRGIRHAEACMLCCIMGATSSDGIHWTKTAQPLLIESEEARMCQDADTHYMNFLRPSLHWEGGRWRMWFDYLHPTLRQQCLGLAENTGAFDAPGGFRPVHDLGRPLIPGWPNPEVVRVGTRYYAFGDPYGFPATPGAGLDWRSRQLCEAVSDDGLTWRIVGYIAPQADESACHVPQALVTTVSGKPWLYLFYAVQRGGVVRLAGAEQYDFRYDRIRAMRRPVGP